MNDVSPILILIRGVPGSGKSFLTRALIDRLGSDRTIALDPDSTDYVGPEYLAFSHALDKEGIDKKFHPYRYIRSQAHAAIDAHKILIWNQPFISLDGFNKTITNLQQYAADHSLDLPLLVIEVELPADIAKQRVVERKALGGHGPSEDTFTRFTNDYESFAKHGYDVITVHGHKEVDAAVEAIYAAVSKLR